MKSEEDAIVRIAKALSDKSRIKILKEIASKGSISCGEVEKVIDLSQPAISHHLKILTEAGLLHTEKDGRHVIISVNKETLGEFHTMLDETI